MAEASFYFAECRRCLAADLGQHYVNNKRVTGLDIAEAAGSFGQKVVRACHMTSSTCDYASRNACADSCGKGRHPSFIFRTCLSKISFESLDLVLAVSSTLEDFLELILVRTEIIMKILMQNF